MKISDYVNIETFLRIIMTTQSIRWQPSELELNLQKAIKQQADNIVDGWIELTVPEDDLTHEAAFTVQIARIPFERWVSQSFRHRFDEWDIVAPLGIKGHAVDDRNHSDWWISTGLPVEYAYGRKMLASNDWLDKDNPDYVTPPSNEEELISKSKRVIDYAWFIKFEAAHRSRNSIFLVSTKTQFEGYVFHIKGLEDIEPFLVEAKRRAAGFFTSHMIAVVPNCSIVYNAVIHHAAAIITPVGSAAAHLVKIAREDDIPVILCPDAYTEFYEYELITIDNKTIRGRY